MGLLRKRKIVLALGGGSARGLAHIGVLKVFERHFGRDKMPFDMIVGTSIGSLIGAAYCLGMPVDELEEKALGFNWPTMVDPGLYATGLVKGDKLEKVIHNIIGTRGFREMKVPFALTTTDIETGEELVHTSGDLIKLIRASCSWPGVFNAVELDGRLLVDGGVRNSIPTKAAYAMGATFVVAINPGFAVRHQRIKHVMEAIIQFIQIMGEELNSYQAKVSDIAIKPDLPDVDQFGFDKARIIIDAGEAAAEKEIGRLKRKLFFHR